MQDPPRPAVAVATVRWCAARCRHPRNTCQQKKAGGREEESKEKGLFYGFLKRICAWIGVAWSLAYPPLPAWPGGGGSGSGGTREAAHSVACTLQRWQAGCSKKQIQNKQSHGPSGSPLSSGLWSSPNTCAILFAFRLVEPRICDLNGASGSARFAAPHESYFMLPGMPSGSWSTAILLVRGAATQHSTA